MIRSVRNVAAIVLVVAACGRVGFDQYGVSEVSDASNPPDVPPGVLVLVPVADAYVRGGIYAQRNFGGETSLYLKNEGAISDWTRESYLRFELPQVPAATLREAVLHCVIVDAGSQAPLMLVTVSRIRTLWLETDIMWSNKPQPGEPLTTFMFTAGAGYIDLDLTAAVSEALGGELSIQFSSATSTANNAVIRLASREHQTPTTLRIVCDGGC